MNFKIFLFLSQVYVHILFFVGLIFFPLYVSIPIIILSQIIYVGACGTVFFHRVVAHKNKVKPLVEKILLFLSWIGVSGSALAWAGTHRKHHRFSDTERDPHSPEHIGYLRAYWLSSGDRDIVRYVPDLLRKKMYVFQHEYYFQFLLLIHIFGFIFLPLMYYWALFIVPAFLMWFAGSTINVFCHKNLSPRNVEILGYIHAGEGWHQNHHEDAASPWFKNKFDWGHLIYRAVS